MDDKIKSVDFVTRCQKKILCKMGSKRLSKLLVDEKTAALLDEVYKMYKMLTRDRKVAEKFLENTIKIIIKVRILQKNKLYTDKELLIAKKLEQKIRTIAMTIVSFVEVDFSFDEEILSKRFHEGRILLKEIIASHLSAKSQDRINYVFDILENQNMLKSIFDPVSNCHSSLCKIVARLSELLENGRI